MDLREFWLVYSPTGTTPPKYQHQSEATALAECDRLAGQYPGSVFYALKAVYTARVERRYLHKAECACESCICECGHARIAHRNRNNTYHECMSDLPTARSRHAFITHEPCKCRMYKPLPPIEF